MGVGLNGCIDSVTSMYHYIHVLCLLAFSLDWMGKKASKTCYLRRGCCLGETGVPAETQVAELEGCTEAATQKLGTAAGSPGQCAPLGLKAHTKLITLISTVHFKTYQHLSQV